MSVFTRNGHGGNGASGPGDERAVGERSSGASVRPLAEAPDPELVERAQRRRFTSAYKLAIVHEADHLADRPGEIGALLRREGLYSSHLTKWRRLRDEGALQALSQPRGPKPPHPLEVENALLKRLRGTFIPIHAANQDKCTPQVQARPICKDRQGKRTSPRFWARVGP